MSELITFFWDPPLVVDDPDGDRVVRLWPADYFHPKQRAGAVSVSIILTSRQNRYRASDAADKSLLKSGKKLSRWNLAS
jgi:hypothetical protein